VRHPDLLVVAHAGKQDRVGAGKVQQCKTELALIPFANFTTQQVGDQMLAITDAEYRQTGGQNRCLQRRARLVVDAARSAGYDNPSSAAQLLQTGVARKDLRGNAEFPYFSGDKVTVLTARVEYRDLRRRDCDVLSRYPSPLYFFIRSTTIL
jgi:hypothetical protein